MDSVAGIGAFLASKRVEERGRAIGIDFSDDMLAKATKAARDNGFTNVELRKGDVEDRIPVEDNSVDVAVRMDWQEWSFLT